MDSRMLPSPAPDEPGTLVSIAATEETLVADVRACMTPAQMVDSRLAILLHSTPPPVGRMDPVAQRRTRP
ncbi:MAG TPA: hypothetical protein VMS17_04950 [Gemmataceae bacterium]|nr:hypothetical protein [Gemmataceae bacterium]